MLDRDYSACKAELEHEKAAEKCWT